MHGAGINSHNFLKQQVNASNIFKESAIQQTKNIQTAILNSTINENTAKICSRIEANPKKI